MSKLVEIDIEQLTSELDELKDQKARYTFELKQIDKEIEKRECALGLFLKQNRLDNYVHGRFEFYFKEYQRTAFDQKAFQTDYPELYAKYKTPKTSERFEFKIV